jgi:hypothetical protein
MAWEARNERRYYYHSRRVAGEVRKVYCGCGALGQVAAELDARRREERLARLAALAAERGRLEEVQALSRRLDAACALLVEAALLVSGFHRPHRVPWRRWHAAWRAANDRSGAARRR